MSTEPLTLAELRRLEDRIMPDGSEYREDCCCHQCMSVRAVRELIALRESMDEEQQGMPWKKIHKNDVVKILELEKEHDELREAWGAVTDAKVALQARYVRLRKAAEEAKEEMGKLSNGYSAEVRVIQRILRAALEEGKA